MHDLKRLCLVAVAALCTVNGGAPRAQDLPVGTSVRSLTAGRFALEIDGAFAGFVDLVEGGNGFSDVVEEPLMSSLSYRKKHTGSVGYRALTLQIGSDMSQVLADWIKVTFAGSLFQRKNGAIVGLDTTYTERRRLEFFNALITEVGMPALDASSKDAAKMTVVIEPEFTRQVAPHPGRYPAQVCKQKPALTSNFRLSIDGVDTSKTRAIDALTMKVVFVDSGPGEERLPGRQPGYVSFSNVVVALPESAADSMNQWFQSFVIQGNAGDDQEKGGTLEYLNPTLSLALVTLTFNHLGIFELASENEGAKDRIRTMVAKMYVESMTFNLTSACGS